MDKARSRFLRYDYRIVMQIAPLRDINTSLSALSIDSSLFSSGTSFARLAPWLVFAPSSCRRQ